MKRYLLCAALDAHQLSSNRFLGYCRTRAAQLAGLARRGEELIVEIYEFRTGVVHSIDVKWKGSKQIESVNSKQRFAIVTRDDFEKRRLDDDVDEHAFKPGRSGVMSIRNVYDHIVSIGKESPGTLEEFSIYSHAYIDGPILVNSYDDRRVYVPSRLRPSAKGGDYRYLQGTERNPDDKDCRASYDFVAPTMPREKLLQFRSAFSPQGHIWVWGCNFDRKANRLLSIVRRTIGGRADLNDETMLKFRNLTAEQIEAFVEFDDVLKIDRDRLYKYYQADVKFGKVRRALWAKMTSSYIYQAAQAVRVPGIGAMYGTYALFDTGQPSLMSISADTAANVQFYRTHFGVFTDPESRNYGVFRHDMKIAGFDD